MSSSLALSLCQLEKLTGEIPIEVTTKPCEEAWKRLARPSETNLCSARSLRDSCFRVFRNIILSAIDPDCLGFQLRPGLQIITLSE